MQSPNMTEHQALAAVQGPQITTLEIQTKILLDERSALLKQIRETKAEVKKERIERLLQQIDKTASLESLRAGVWNSATLAQRRIACMCANISKERAEDSLTKFNAFERTRMWTALDDLIDGLVTLQKCLNGGHVPQQNTLQ